MTGSLWGIGGVGIALSLAMRTFLLWRAPLYGFDRFQHLALAASRRPAWILGSVAQRYELDRLAGAPTDYPPLATGMLSVFPEGRPRLWFARWGGVVGDMVAGALALGLGGRPVLVALLLLQPLVIGEGLGYGARSLGAIPLVLIAAVAGSSPPAMVAAGIAGAAMLVGMYLHRFTVQAIVVVAVTLSLGGCPQIAIGCGLALVAGVVRPSSGYRLILTEQLRYWRVLDPIMRQGAASVAGLPAGGDALRWAARELVKGAYLAPAALLLGWQTTRCTRAGWLGVMIVFVGVATIPGLRRFGEAGRYLRTASILVMFADPPDLLVLAATVATVVALVRWVVGQRRQVVASDHDATHLARLVQRLSPAAEDVAATWPIDRCLPLFVLTAGPVYTHISYRLAEDAVVLASGGIVAFAQRARRDGVAWLFLHGGIADLDGWTKVDAEATWSAWRPT